MSWEDDIAASGSTLDASADFNTPNTWSGDLGGGVATSNDPLSGFSSVVNMGTNLLKSVAGLQSTVQSAQTQQYVARRQADTQRAVADAQVAAAQKPLKGQYDQLIAWATVIGLAVAAYAAFAHK